MKALTKEEMLAMLDESVHGRIEELLRRSDVTHLVIFENQMMDSSCFGDRTAMIVGPGCTYKDLEAVKGAWLYDLPSQRQYPVAYYTKEAQNG